MSVQRDAAGAGVDAAARLLGRDKKVIVVVPLIHGGASIEAGGYDDADEIANDLEQAARVLKEASGRL